MTEIQQLALQMASLQTDVTWLKGLIFLMLAGQAATGFVVWRNGKGKR